MQLNFLLMEMTHLRYWMPLVIEGNKRGLQSTFFVAASNKYNCPNTHAKVLKEVQDVHGIRLVLANDTDRIAAAKGVFFSSEKTGVNYIKKAVNCKKVVCTYQTDFIESYKEYENFADHVLMPSKFCAEYYKLDNDKNLYLGIPKYEVDLNREEILKKYSLSADKKYVTFISPKSRDQAKVKSGTLMTYLDQLGYSVLFKTRGKDPVDARWKKTLSELGHHCFEDNSWYPHTTQELLEVSDFALNFGSTTIEECVMHNTPLINFDVKPAIRNGSKRPYRVTHDYLYNYNYCIQLNPQWSGDHLASQFNAAVNFLTSADLTGEFKKAKQNHLFDHKDPCKRILDVLL